MALSPKWRSENDQILGDACMDNVHRAHRTAGVVEDPFLFARVEYNALFRGRKLCREVGDNVRDNGAGVVAMFVNSRTRKGVEFCRFENIPPMLFTVVRLCFMLLLRGKHTLIESK